MIAWHYLGADSSVVATLESIQRREMVAIMSVTEGELLWTPEMEFAEGSNIAAYMRWLRDRGLANVEDYSSLWQWSVEDIERFWASLWEYFDIQSDAPYEQIIDAHEFAPGRRWFTGSRVNLAEHILRNERDGAVAFHHLSEVRAQQAITWPDLAAKVRTMATTMRARGLKPGDAVCCLMPNIVESVVAMLASVSIGCVWSNAAPEFGGKTILERFTQIGPRWLFVADGYQFGGKEFMRNEETRTIVAGLKETLEQVVYLPYIRPSEKTPPVEAMLFEELLQARDPGREQFHYERVAHDHPLWVLFSSGTTGLPKAIVHGHVGVLMELLKTMHFHMNLLPAPGIVL